MIKRNIFWAILNSGSGTLVTFFASIYITRSINPGIFIQLSILFSFLALSNIFIDCGLSSNLLLVSSLAHDDISIHESEMYKRSYVVFTLYIIFAILLSSRFNLSPLLLFSPSLLIILYPYNFHGNLIFNRNKMFKEKMIFSLLASFLSSINAVFLTFIGLPALAFVSSQILAPLVLAVCLRIRLKTSIIPPIFSINNFNIFELYSAFSFKVFSSSFFFQLYENINPLISKMFMFAISPVLYAPLYTKNDSFLMFPFKLLKKSISRVTIATLGSIDASSNKLLRPLRKYIVYTVISSFLLFLFILFLGKYIVLFALGPKWVLPDLYYKLLACLIFTQMLSSQFMNQINILTKSFKYTSKVYLSSILFLLSASSILYLLGYLSFFIFIILLLVSEIYKTIIPVIYITKYSPLLNQSFNSD